MKFLSLEPFIPSGSDFDRSRELFLELGFKINWDAGDYAGLERDGCKFILQKFDHKEFAENFMISVHVDDVDQFWQEINKKQLVRRFGIRISPPTEMPYGKESNIIDLAGVCWHFVE